MKRAAHLFAVTVGPLMAILAYAQKLPYPRVAFVAGLVLAVLGQLRTAFAPMGDDAKTKGAAVVFLALFAGYALYGCATASGIYQVCKPATADEKQAVDAVFADPTLTQAEVIATLEGGKIALCVITQIAKDIVGTSNTLAYATPGSLMSPRLEEPPMVARARAWIAKHP